MPTATAQNRKALEGHIVTAGLKRLGRILAAFVFLSFALSFFAGGAEAKMVPWWAKKIYTLNLSLDYAYESEWADNGNKLSTFTQIYNFSHAGYIVDPRLAYYSTGISFSDSSRIEGDGGDYSATGFNINLTLFEGINRGRGLNMWKYVPSPINLRYGIDILSNGITQQYYAVSMYYARPGTLRVFSNKKVIFYDDGTNNNVDLRRNLNGNRYRYKYNNSNYNVNGNGTGDSNWNRNRNNNGNANWNQTGYTNRNRNNNVNSNVNRNRNLNGDRNLNMNSNVDGNLNSNSNWNRNSNSSWNRNGNSNFNRNGNSNWNRNGNSNWNRNGNSNWNRNGNSNWNRNWNRNFNNNNVNYSRRIPGMGLFSFAYPQFSLDYSRGTATGGYSSSTGSVRMSINNPPKYKNNKIRVYRSNYIFSYIFREGTRIDKTSTASVLTSHEWTRSSLNNLFTYEIIGQQKSYYFDTTYNYWNEFKIKQQPIPYIAGLNGNYWDTAGVSRWSAFGYLKMSTSKKRKPMPGLTTSSGVSMNYSRKHNSLSQGDNIYSVSLTEQIHSTQLRKITLSGSFSTSYSESGVPVGLQGRIIYVPNRKFTLEGGYNFSTFFRKEYRGMTFYHRAYFSTRYQIRANLSYSGDISHTMEQTKNGVSYTSNMTQIRSGIGWNINNRSTLSGNGSYEFGGNYRNMSLNVYYRRNLNARSNLFIGAGVVKPNSGELHKQLDVGYDFSYRRISFSASYALRMYGGYSEHKLSLRLSRTFERVFTKLW